MNTAALRTVVLVVLAAVFLAGSPLAPALSSAAFTAKSANAGNTVGAAADWTAPAVAVDPPAGTLRDTATITATASDAETGIRSVAVSVRGAGGATWTTLCTANTAPYACAWNTRAVADGAYELRAVATDNAGYATTSALVAATVGNTVSIVLTDPGEILRGSVPLASTLQNAGSSAYTVTVEYAPAGSTNAAAWKAACTTTAAPYSCTWNTASVAGDFYDLRASVTANGVTTVSSVIADVLVDNGAPTVSMVDPGSPLRGTVTLAATAADTLSGVARVVIQLAPAGTSAWQDACTVTTAPYSCRFTTTTLAGGGYAFRAMATDAAGNTATSATVSPRTVDNSIASVAMEDPGAYLGGMETLTATANSSAGVGSVTIQYAPSGTATWTTACAVGASPYACAWNSAGVTDGLYDFRAVLTDGVGTQTTSAVVSARRVDNRAVRGTDVQTANGGGVAGRLDTGDTMTFTYSTQLNPASIAAGWNGTATPVTLRLRDGNLLGLGNSGDSVDIQRSGGAVNLGSVNLKGDYVKSNKTSTFNATMTATTTTVNGLPVTVVQISIGTLLGGGALRTAPTTAAAAMVWTPSNAAADLAGTVSSNAPVTETGNLDREY